jgi:hypothetical protein
VGAGGLSVTFFMYLMFWVPHPNAPVPVFEDIAAALATGNTALSIGIAVAMLGIAVFGALNIAMLIWNLRRVGDFTQSERGKALINSNAGTQMLTMPLALAMSINAGFVLGLVFVPGLWSIVEYLFPMALLAFLAVGVLAFSQLGGFIKRIVSSGGFDCTKNNSFGQMMPAFALAMVGVGLAAPAAMSTVALISGISIVLSSFFLISAVIITVITLMLGLRAIMEHGIAAEQAPTLMMVIPIVTILGILMLRQSHGLHVHFDSHGGPGADLVLLSRLLSVQALFAMLGVAVLSATGYVGRFLSGETVSPGNYSLICPGVALSVMMHFWINKGLVGAELIVKFGTAYWVLTAIALAFQFAMVALMLFLHRRHFMAPRGSRLSAA